MRGLDAIERNGNARRRGMISDLLDMSRLNLGKMRLVLSRWSTCRDLLTGAIECVEGRPATRSGCRSA